MYRALWVKLLRVAVVAGLIVAVQAPGIAYAADNYEPNNDIGSAYLLTGSTTISSYIYTGNDEDWYRFQVWNPVHVRLFLDVPVNVDYELALFDPDGYMLDGTSSGVGVDESIDWTIDEPGTYYIRVVGFGGDYNQTTPYSLTLSNPKTGDTWEPNNTLETAAGPLKSGSSITSYIFTGNDDDWYCFGVTSPTHVSISLDVPSDRDYELELYDSESGWTLASSTNGTGMDESIEYTIQTPGNYYVRVRGYSDEYSQSLSYRLTATGAGMSTCTRIAGESRIDTAVKASQRAFPRGATSAVIATSRNYPDALAGAVLAQAYNGPLLLVEPDDVPWALQEEIDRLGVRDVYILGGTGAVSSWVEDTLADEDTLVHRISGSNRFETARKISEEIVRKKGARPTTAFVATGRNFADALAASPYAARKGYPILLTEPGSLSADTRTALANMGVTKVFVMGGSTAVSSAVENSIASMGIVTQRVQGSTRVDTSVALAKIATADGMSMARPLVATGYNFPDALAGGVLGARLGSPLLLTKPTELSAPTSTYMAQTKAGTSEVVILGGYGAVSLSVQQAIDNIY